MLEKKSNWDFLSSHLLELCLGLPRENLSITLVTRYQLWRLNINNVQHRVVSGYNIIKLTLFSFLSAKDKFRSPKKSHLLQFNLVSPNISVTNQYQGLERTLDVRQPSCWFKIMYIIYPKLMKFFVMLASSLILINNNINEEKNKE